MTAQDSRTGRADRFWNHTSAWPKSDWAEQKSRQIHELIAAHLDLELGESVLDIGCGRGAFFGMLRDAVGPTGRVVGVDRSPTAVQRAQADIDQAGWANVAVHRADFTAGPVEAGSFDAAIAVFALSAMSDVPAALANAHASLRPGGRLFVIDLRLEPRGLAGPLIRVCRLVYKLFAGWTGVDVRDTAQDRFAKLTPVRPASAPVTPTRKSWPPVAMFVAERAAEPSRSMDA